jgi:glyoxylase-like metal-dependent hydrolase (beta-lactamase superfamily II)
MTPAGGRPDHRPDHGPDHRPVRVGRIEVVPVCEGFAPLALADELPGTHVDWDEERRRYPWAFVDADAWPWHVHAFAVRTPTRLVLVDSGLGSFPPYRPWSDHTDRVVALERAGLRAAEVDDVVLTHLHADHAGGVATADGEPRFPNARVHVHAADRAHFEAARDDGPSYHAGRGVAALDERGLVDTTAEDHEVVPGVWVLHTPGHTPGHRSVLLEGDGERLLLTGDLLHVPAQAAHAGRPSSHDEDPEVGARSRRALLGRAAAERWRVGVSHFARPFGRVGGDGTWGAAMP